MTIEQLVEAMKEIADVAEAENRSLTDEEITRYEALESDLKAAKKTAEIRARQSAYETPNIIVRPVGAGKGDEVLERAFSDYLRTGIENQDIVELRAQSTSTTAGGYTVPTGFRNKLVEVQKQFGGIRSAAEVITTAEGNSLPIPTNDDTANSGAITAENTAISNGDDFVFGQVTLGAFKYTSAGTGSNLPVLASYELLQDSAIDVDSFVSRKLGERIHRKQARDFAIGEGSTTAPNGLFITTSDLNDAGTTLSLNKLIDMYHEVDPVYRVNASWVMNDSTMAELEKLVGTDGRQLLQPYGDSTIANGHGLSLLGKPVILDQATVTASGSNYLAFGDIREAYIIRDVRDVVVVRDPFSYSRAGQVAFHAWARADADIKNRAAFATLKSHRVA